MLLAKMIMAPNNAIKNDKNVWLVAWLVLIKCVFFKKTKKIKSKKNEIKCMHACE